MENKKVGYIILGISVLVGAIILLFNRALKDIVSLSCGSAHTTFCPMSQNINQQTYIALGVVGLLVIVALVLIFTKPQEKVIIRKVKEKKPRKKINTSELRQDEKEVLELVRDNKAVFQADLIEKTGFNKTKMTRIIDKLDGLGLIERKRRGMTNVVVLKE